MFREREFLAFFIARQSSLVGYGIETGAIGWQIFSLRHQPFDIGLVGLILFLPQLLLALPAGIIADRLDRRLVCVFVTCAEMGGLALLATLALLGTRSLAVYLCAVAFVGVAHAIGAPAERSLLAGIVRSHSFVRAQALSSSVGQLIMIAAPSLGGVLIAFGTPVAFGVSAASYAAAAVGFLFLKPRDVVHDDMPMLRAAMAGIRFIFDRKVVLGAISLDLFAVLFGGATALLPVYASTILQVGPTGYGALMSAPALGAALVAAFISRRPISRNAGPLLFWCVAGFGVFTIVFGLSRNFWLSIVVLALAGGFDMVSVVIRSALVQLRTPDAMRGRVNAVENVFIGASNQLGAFESGTLAQFIGAQGSVVLGGVATLVVIGLWTVLFPALRAFDRLVETPNG